MMALVLPPAKSITPPVFVNVVPPSVKPPLLKVIPLRMRFDRLLVLLSRVAPEKMTLSLFTGAPISQFAPVPQLLSALPPVQVLVVAPWALPAMARHKQQMRNVEFQEGGFLAEVFISVEGVQVKLSCRLADSIFDTTSPRRDEQDFMLTVCRPHPCCGIASSVDVAPGAELRLGEDSRPQGFLIEGALSIQISFY
jgi:hypothetical protein